MAGATSPKILKPILVRTLGHVGGRVTLEAVVIGRPVPVITWHKNGLPVTKDERHLMRYEERGTCCLTLLNVCGEDEGEYECRARNRLGQASCFGQLYVTDGVVGLESGMKHLGLRQPPTHCSSRNETQHQQIDADDNNDEAESQSGLFILIDEGSQDENSADEMGRKESISASEQIESIIEDLRLRDGSLNFSLAKQGCCSSEQKVNPTLRQDQRNASCSSPSTGGAANKSVNFKESSEEERRVEGEPNLEFEDSVVLGEEIPITSRGRKSPKCLARNSNPIRPSRVVPLHKVVGVEDNLHRALESESSESNLYLAEYEMIRSANVMEDGWKYRQFVYHPPAGNDDDVVNISPPPEFQNNISESSSCERKLERKALRLNGKQRSASDCHDRLTYLSRPTDDSASSPWESSEEVFDESLELESSVEEVFPPAIEYDECQVADEI